PPYTRQTERGGAEGVRPQTRTTPPPLPPPLGLTHQPRRAVSVEHAAVIERAERSIHDRIAHAHEVRLEAVVVGDVADGAGLFRRGLEPRDRVLFRGPQRLLPQDEVAIAGEGNRDRDIRLRGNARRHPDLTV